MGWASGVTLLDEVVELVNDYCSRATKAPMPESLTKDLVNAFWDADCDTFDDSRHESVRNAWYELNGVEPEDAPFEEY